MKIRSFQAGDEHAQVAIYNVAAAHFPKFKPATVPEVQRRIQARGFEAGMRQYAEVDGKVVGYCSFTGSGRLSYPWVLPGHEACQVPLFEAALAAMKLRQLDRPHAAYRGDWVAVTDFFLRHGFKQVREMVNFTLQFNDMPTPSARQGATMTALEPHDIPALFNLAPEILRVSTPEALHQHLFKNPYFPPESVFVLRSRTEGAPLAAGVLVTDPSYAAPEAVDPMAPCYRLGSFGNEGLEVKRVRGLFSFLTKLDRNMFPLAMEMLSHATYALEEDDDLNCLAAQVRSDVPALLMFYQRTFVKRGSFPVFERDVAL